VHYAVNITTHSQTTVSNKQPLKTSIYESCVLAESIVNLFLARIPSEEEEPSAFTMDGRNAAATSESTIDELLRNLRGLTCRR